MTLLPRASAAPATLLACIVAASPWIARAAELDPATGKLDLDGAVELDLDAAPTGITLYLLDADGTPVDVREESAAYRDAPGGLQGSGHLVAGGAITDVYLPMVGLPMNGAGLMGRRAEITVWQQPCGTRFSFSLGWYIGSGADPHFAGALNFTPTGRATDDGWEEWSSGPFDWAFGGIAPPVYFVASDVQANAVRRGQFIEIDPELCARLDAFEIHDRGPAAVPTSTCTSIDEESACGPLGACSLGRCVDAAALHGAVPADDSIRADYVRRRRFEIANFEGGRVPQAHMAELLTRFDALALDAPNARFWVTLADAVEALEDGHASAPIAGYGTYAFTGVCAYRGDADLVAPGEVLPLVFESRDNAVGNQLEPGDAITAIDGLPPDAWAAAADHLLSYAGDEDVRATVEAAQLFDAAARSGSVVTLARCTAPPPSGPCDPQSVVTFTLDFATLLGQPLFAGTSPGWRYDWIACDFRFRREVASPNVRSYEFAGFADAGGVRTILINGVPAASQSAWYQTVFDALAGGPSRVILDQRQGAGGSVEAVDLLASLLLAPSDFDRMLLVPWDERDLDAALLESCSANASPIDTCGNGWVWNLGELAALGPQNGAAGDTALAVINAYDVSGNDFTSKLLAYRSGPVRIFGPAPTVGAFGVIWGLPAHLDELSGGSVQVHDTIFLANAASPYAFATGAGVPPHDVVLQSQRDLTAGVDTVLTAARAWLAGIGP